MLRLPCETWVRSSHPPGHALVLATSPSDLVTLWVRGVSTMDEFAIYGRWLAEHRRGRRRRGQFAPVLRVPAGGWLWSVVRDDLF